MAVLWLAVALLLARSAWADSAQVQEPSEAPRYYFLNEVTGAIQLTDPGNTPWEEADGTKFWLHPETGERLKEDPHRLQWAWIENFSQDMQRPFYFNQVTRESTWDKPADLAWRRVRVPDD